MTREPAVYVLVCNDGTLYTGCTLDLRKRVEAHRRGKAARYTRSRLPVRLLAWWHPETLSAARSHEARFKRLRRAVKLAALQGGEVYGCRLFSHANVRDAT